MNQVSRQRHREFSIFIGGQFYHISVGEGYIDRLSAQIRRTIRRRKSFSGNGKVHSRRHWSNHAGNYRMEVVLEEIPGSVETVGLPTQDTVLEAQDDQGILSLSDIDSEVVRKYVVNPDGNTADGQNNGKPGVEKVRQIPVVHTNYRSPKYWRGRKPGRKPKLLRTHSQLVNALEQIASGKKNPGDYSAGNNLDRERLHAMRVLRKRGISEMPESVASADYSQLQGYYCKTPVQ